MPNATSIVIVAAIIALVLIMARASSVELFASVDVDKLVYGKISSYWQDITNRQITAFKMPLKFNSIPAPPKNSSKAVLDEIKYLAKLTANPPTKIVAPTRASTLNYFIKYAGENGLVYDNTHLSTAFYDVEALCVKLQSIYNRPRPAQLAFIYNTKIMTIGTAETPSYPCCCTVQAFVLADLLKHNNPKHADTLDAMCKKVELSQLYTGQNYPSDNDAAKKVAAIIIKNISYLYIK